MATKNCKVCGEIFTLSQVLGGNNQVTCSDKCRDENNRILKRESFLRLKDEKNKIIHYYSNLWRIPIYQVIKYGVDFLKSNPSVVEVIQLQTKLSGRFQFLTEEEKDIRRKAVIRDNNKKHRDKRGYNKKPCKICGKEFIPGIDVKSNRAVCCSELCSKERNRIQTNEASARQREKKKLLSNKNKIEI